MSILIDFKESLTSLGALNLYIIEERYHCTPVESELLASIGIDGIHYCILPMDNKSLDDSPVLVVSPHSYVEVLPVAENITDFISLVVTLKEAGGIEAAALRDKHSFLQYLEEGLLDDPEYSALVNQAVEYCKHKFSVSEMENPYEYIQAMKQKYKNITYTLPDMD